MEPANFNPWLSGAALVISIAGSVYAWFTAKSKVNEQKIAELARETDEVERRVQSLESEMKHLPAKDDVVELKLTIAELKGAVAVFGESLAGVQRTVQRIDTFLREPK